MATGGSGTPTPSPGRRPRITVSDMLSPTKDGHDDRDRRLPPLPTRQSSSSGISTPVYQHPGPPPPQQQHPHQQYQQQQQHPQHAHSDRGSLPDGGIRPPHWYPRGVIKPEVDMPPHDHNVEINGWHPYRADWWRNQQEFPGPGGGGPRPMPIPASLRAASSPPSLDQQERNEMDQARMLPSPRYGEPSRRGVRETQRSQIEGPRRTDDPPRAYFTPGVPPPNLRVNSWDNEAASAYDRGWEDALIAVESGIFCVDGIVHHRVPMWPPPRRRRDDRADREQQPNFGQPARERERPPGPPDDRHFADREMERRRAYQRERVDWERERGLTTGYRYPEYYPRPEYQPFPPPEYRDYYPHQWQPQMVPNPAPQLRHRQMISCHRCRSRKVKCSGGRPCEACKKIKRPNECRYEETIRRRGKGKKRMNGVTESGGESGGESMSPNQKSKVENGEEREQWEVKRSRSESPERLGEKSQRPDL